MLRVTAGIFGLIYLVASFNMTINFHYCHDNLVAVSFFDSTSCSVDADGKPCKMKCCSDEQIVIEIGDDQFQSSTQVLNLQEVAVVMPMVILTMEETAQVEESSIEPRAGPPDVPRPKLYTLYSSRIFYA